VTTLDRSKLTQRIGELNSTELRQVEDGIKAAMDLRQLKKDCWEIVGSVIGTRSDGSLYGLSSGSLGFT
jgi:hypothetical protein